MTERERERKTERERERKRERKSFICASLRATSTVIYWEKKEETKGNISQINQKFQKHHLAGTSQFYLTNEKKVFE